MFSERHEAAARGWLFEVVCVAPGSQEIRKNRLRSGAGFSDVRLGPRPHYEDLPCISALAPFHDIHAGRREEPAEGAKARCQIPRTGH